MKRIFVAILIVGLAALIAYRFLQRREVRASVTINQIQAKEGYPVEVEASVLSHFRMVRQYTGTVVGDQEADVVPLVGEYVSKLTVKEGQNVEAGQTICELSRDNPSASFAQAKLLYENANRDQKRMEALFAQGAISRQVLDNATLGSDLARERLETSEKLLEVKSPISGILTDLKAEVGMFVAPGMPVARVVSRGDLRVLVDIPSHDRDKIRPGMSVKVKTPEGWMPAIVRRVALSADRGSRSFTGWVEMEKSESAYTLRSGLLVEVEVVVIDVPDAVTVSDDAVLRAGDERWIYTIDRDQAVKNRVVIGGASEGRTWIPSGLESGVSVVSSGGNNLSDGAKIRIVTKGS